MAVQVAIAMGHRSGVLQRRFREEGVADDARDYRVRRQQRAVAVRDDCLPVHGKAGEPGRRVACQVGDEFPGIPARQRRGEIRLQSCQPFRAPHAAALRAPRPAAASRAAFALAASASSTSRAGMSVSHSINVGTGPSRAMVSA